MNSTIWITITENDNYEISEYGEVRRRKSKRPVKPFKADGLRRASGEAAKTAPGYWAVNLCRNSKVTAYYVHRLVCRAFHGDQPTPDQKWVSHHDDDRDNNHFSNLRWASPKENYADAVRNGRISDHASRAGPRHSYNSGSTNGRSKLTIDQVIAIRADPRKNKAAIAREYGLHRVSVYYILNGKNWKT